MTPSQLAATRTFPQSHTVLAAPRRDDGGAPRAAHGLALLIVFLVWMIFAGPLFLLPGNLYLVDIALNDLPNRLHAAEQIRAGHWPFWTPATECGFPLFSDGQTGVAYPLFALYVLWPSPEMHDIWMALHYLIAGLTMYVFLVGRGASPFASAIGACGYFGSAPLMALHVIPGVIATMCWAPLALWLIDRHAAGDPRALWWCALVNGVMLLAGFPNGSLFSFSLEAAYLCFRVGKQPESLFRGGMIALGLPALLAMVQLLPTLQFFWNSHRSESLSWEAVYYNRVETLPQLMTVGVSGVAALSAFYWGYLAAAALALYGLFAWRNRAEALFWGGFLLLTLLVAFATPVAWIFYYLPVFSWFRWPSLYLLVSTLAYSVLIAFGADMALSVLSRSLPIRSIVAAVAALAVTSPTFADCLAPPGWDQTASPAILAAAHREGHFRLLPLMHGQIEGADPEHDERFWSPQRLRNSFLTLAANYHLLHGARVATIKNQFDAVTPAEMTHLLATDRNISLGYLQAAAITHISDVEPLPAHLLAAAELVSDDPVRLYRVRNPLPRAWLVYDARRIDSPHERVKAIHAGDFDARRLAIVDTDPQIGPAPTKPAQVALRETSPSSLEIEVETETPGLLVVADMHATSVHAAIDGGAAPLLKANHAFRGVRVPAGRHVVTMWYRPTAFYVGACVSLAALAVVAAQLARPLRRDAPSHEALA
ncbi:MAG: hypothetical protein K1X71_02190 [Pirellulales bacterium]|nr:hypothetical protein [Pirellulales bacterium]